MRNQDFTDNDWLIETVNDYLTKTNIIFTKENPDPDLVNFQFTIKEELLKLTIIVGQDKEHNHQIDVVSPVNFSQVHIDALNQFKKEEKAQLANTLFFWLTPRHPLFILNLEPTQENVSPYYLIIMSIYEGDLTLGKLMETINLVEKSSQIARRIIQQNLQKYVINKEIKEEVKVNE